DLATGLGSPVADALSVDLSGNIGTPVPRGPSDVVSDTLSPTFRWDLVPGATSYHLVVTDRNPFVNASPPAGSPNVIDTILYGASSYFPTGVTLNSTYGYSWTIQAVGAFGEMSATSDPLGFRF